LLSFIGYFISNSSHLCFDRYYSSKQYNYDKYINDYHNNSIQYNYDKYTNYYHNFRGR